MLFQIQNRPGPSTYRGQIDERRLKGGILSAPLTYDEKRLLIKQLLLTVLGLILDEINKSEKSIYFRITSERDRLLLQIVDRSNDQDSEKCLLMREQIFWTMP